MLGPKSLWKGRSLNKLERLIAVRLASTDTTGTGSADTDTSVGVGVGRWGSYCLVATHPEVRSGVNC